MMAGSPGAEAQHRLELGVCVRVLHRALCADPVPVARRGEHRIQGRDPAGPFQQGTPAVPRRGPVLRCTAGEGSRRSRPSRCPGLAVLAAVFVSGCSTASPPQHSERLQKAARLKTLNVDAATPRSR
jgi:hypothetical protein